MKKLFSITLCLLLFFSIDVMAWAELPGPHKNVVTELYSAEGTYTDDVGNIESYSYHVPQINVDTPAAKEINQEITERFGEPVESQFANMTEGYSLWFWRNTWHSYWHGSRLFLLIEAEMEGDFNDYAVYGYDFENDCHVTSEMILQELGITQEVYLENLREKVQLMFEDTFAGHPQREEFGYDELLAKTMEGLDLAQPMFIDGSGQLETIVKFYVPAGAGWYYHLVTPFAYG